MQKIKKLIKKIKNLTSKKKISKKDLNLYIKNIVLLNLSVEKIILKNNRINPIIQSEKVLSKFYNFVKLLGKNKKNKYDFQNQEEQHKKIFQRLWTSYNFKEYIKYRVQRYNYRIKINNLQNKIKNKKCIDFGCGHGNFLVAMYLNGASECFGLDFGKKNILYANKLINKLSLDSKKIKFKCSNVYKAPVNKNYFDFAIQNGVFHHLDYEDRAYKEVYRVLKSKGYFWVYTDGGGGIRDLVSDMSQRLLKHISRNYVFDVISSMKLGVNKNYHISDNLTAKYRHHTFKSITKKLSKCGFNNFVQLKGGFKTDFDRPFSKLSFFKERFGSGDLRILCQKK